MLSRDVKTVRDGLVPEPFTKPTYTRNCVRHLGIGPSNIYDIFPTMPFKVTCICCHFPVQVLSFV